MSSGIRVAAVNALPCSLNLSSALSIPYVSSRPTSPQHESIVAFVPFSWEEKPGISKRFGSGLGYNRANSKRSSKESECEKLFVDDLDIVPLPMPPRLQKPFAFELNTSDFTKSPAWSRCYAQKRSVANSPSTKQQPRKGRAEDDPFFRAMKACTMRNSANCEGSHEPARRLSRSTLLQKLFETEEQQSKPNKIHNWRVSDSLSVDAKPALGMSVGHFDRGQCLEEPGNRVSGEQWKHREPRNSSPPGTKPGVMILSQRRLILGDCLGCKNPDGFEPSAILAKAKASTSPRSSH